MGAEQPALGLLRQIGRKQARQKGLAVLGAPVIYVGRQRSRAWTRPRAADERRVLYEAR